MSAVMTDEAPAVNVEPRCRIEDVFAGNFIDLLAMVPRNPTVRGLVLAQTRKMPPPECATFEQLKEWVETNCEKKLHRPNPTARFDGGIAIVVEFSETEYGRANYSVQRSGSEEFRLDEEELLGMVQETIDSGDNLDVLVEAIAEKVRDDAWTQCDPSLEDYGDYDYGEHDSNDSGNAETDFSKAQIRDRLLAHLREHHPGLLEELT
jgi:hypothetical protein